VEVKMRYTIILTPTAKSDIVNLKSSLEQQIIDSSFIRKELKKEYGHDELGPGDQFMYIRHVGAIIIGIIVVIIMIIRLIIYGNTYYEW